MAPGHIEAITLTNVDRLHPSARRSLFWQMAESANSGDQQVSADRVLGIPAADRINGGHAEVEDPMLEKEAWLNSVIYEWGMCGYTVSENEFSPAVATVLFAPPLYMPKSRTMAAGPVSPDAVLLSSLHIQPEYLGLGYEGALITAVVHNLAARGVKAVEAFGCSGGGEVADQQPGLGELSLAVSVDDANPFDIEDSLDQAEAMIREFERAEARRACDPGTLGDIGHGSGDLPQTRVLFNAGFTVVKPHQRHPRLRLELDGDWDWSAAVGEALDHLAATQMAEALLAQLNP